ncbi:MAG: hypothetical protein WCP14_01510 [bacterium]
MARPRKRLDPTLAGNLIFSIAGISDDHNLVEIADIVKEEIGLWQACIDHPERRNYRLHVVGGSDQKLPDFVLEHKDETYTSAVADVWDLDVEVLDEDSHLRVTCRL